MRFFCVTRQRLGATNRSLRAACASRGIDFVAVAPGAVWHPLGGGPEPGDLLYRAVDGGAAVHVEAVLLEDGVATFHRRPGFVAADPLAALVRAGLPVPRTVFNLVRHPQALAGCVAALGGYPVVLKPAAADADRAAIRVDGPEQLAELAERHSGPAVLQELVPHDRALRLVVVGDAVVACHGSRPADGDFRSDGPGAASLGPMSPPLGAADLAGRAVQLLGLEAGAVDLLVDDAERLVLMGVDLPFDVAASERACAVDVAGAMLDHLVDKAAAMAAADG